MRTLKFYALLLLTTLFGCHDGRTLDVDSFSIGDLNLSRQKLTSETVYSRFERHFKTKGHKVEEGVAIVGGCKLYVREPYSGYLRFYLEAPRDLERKKLEDADQQLRDFLSHPDFGFGDAFSRLPSIGKTFQESGISLDAK